MDSGSAEKNRQTQYNYKYNHWYWFVIAGITAVFFVRHVLLYSVRLLHILPFPVTALETVGNLTFRRPLGKRVGKWVGLSWGQLAAITFLVIWNLVFLFVNSLPPHFHDGAKNSRLKFIAKRGGSMVIQNLPLVFALSGRHNIISFLTGIPAQKLRFLHKTVGRLLGVAALFHAIAMSVSESAYSGFHAYQEWLNEDVVRRGILAISGVAILFFFSLRPIRRHLYELFLSTHYIGAATVLAGVYLHRPKRVNWIYACIALWCFDHVFRIVTIIFNHLLFPLLFKRFSQAGRANATLRLVADSIVLEVPHSGPWKEGQHCFVTFIDGKLWKMPWRWIESHPWSVANVPSALGPGEYEKSQIPASKSLLFVIGHKGGITRDLRRILENCPISEKGVPETNINVIVEGPHGCSTDTSSFEQIVLIAGGSGITHPLSQFLGLIERAKEGTFGETRKVCLCWSIKHLDQISWVAPYLNAAIASLPNSSPIDFSIILYVTQGSLPQSRSPSTAKLFEARDSEPISNDLPHLNSEAASMSVIRLGRLDPSMVIHHATEECDGNTYVSACGPAGMTRAVQVAVTQASSLGKLGAKKGFIKSDLAAFSM